MARLVINIDGREYPCRPTMGAMLRFKRETGKEVSEIGSAVSEMCVYFWCCVQSSCKHDGVDFDMTLEDFADALTNADIEAWNAAVLEETPSAETPALSGKGKN